MSISTLQQILQDPVLSQAVRIGLNLAGMSVLVFGLYYRRYRDKELVTAAALFNFFGAVAIAVITSVHGTTVPFATMAVAFVLAGAYVIDHPKILQSVSGAKVTLDKINTDLLADPVAMRVELSERLGVAVLSYQVLQLDYITEMARLNVYYRTR